MIVEFLELHSVIVVHTELSFVFWGFLSFCVCPGILQEQVGMVMSCQFKKSWRLWMHHQHRCSHSHPREMKFCFCSGDHCHHWQNSQGQSSNWQGCASIQLTMAAAGCKLVCSSLPSLHISKPFLAKAAMLWSSSPPTFMQSTHEEVLRWCQRLLLLFLLMDCVNQMGGVFGLHCLLGVMNVCCRICVDLQK